MLFGYPLFGGDNRTKTAEPSAFVVPYCGGGIENHGKGLCSISGLVTNIRTEIKSPTL